MPGRTHPKLQNKKGAGKTRKNCVFVFFFFFFLVCSLTLQSLPFWCVFWAAANGGVTNGGLRGVWPPFPEIGRNRPFSPFFCLFRPFPEGLKSTWKIQKTEEKDLFPQISSDFLKPPSLKPPFAAPQVFSFFSKDFRGSAKRQTLAISSCFLPKSKVGGSGFPSFFFLKEFRVGAQGPKGFSIFSRNFGFWGVVSGVLNPCLIPLSFLSGSVLALC